MPENLKQKIFDLMRINLKFRPNIILSAILLMAIVFSVVRIGTAIAPDPGHSWSEIGDVGIIDAANLGSGTADSTKFLRGDSTWAAPGGGLPGGANTEIQFNDGGVFGSDADFVWDKTGNSLTLGGTDTRLTLRGITNEPAAPLAENLEIYSKSIAGRMLPKWKGPSGVDTAFQASLGFNRITMVNPGGGAALTYFGITSTNAGTIAHPVLAATNTLTSTKRATFTSGNAAGSMASHRQSGLIVWRGNNVANAPGGFFFTIRFATSTLAAGNRAFVGLTNSIAAPTNIDPLTSTTYGKVGVAINTNSGNWNFIHNITGTAPSVTNLGAGFPVNNTNMYELVLFSPPNGTVINYRLVNISTGASVVGATLPANIPSATTFLSPMFWITNNATASATAIAFAGWYLESDQ